MSRKLKFRARARRDLQALVAFIGEANRDFVVARRVGQRLVNRCRKLLGAPYSGAPLRDKPNVRKIVQGPHKIIYQVSDTKIVILRIWDGRRGHDPLL